MHKSLYILVAIAGAVLATSLIVVPSVQAADLSLLTSTSITADSEPALDKIADFSVTKKDVETDQMAIAPANTLLVTTDYTVGQGEYLEKIAKQHNISWTSLYELNPSITNPDVIYPNQILHIPSQDVPLTRPLPEHISLVVSGSNQAKVTVTTVKQVTTARPVSNSLGAGDALRYVGYPYRYGGNSPSGFDCSGFTQYIAAQQGIHLPRTVMAQFAATTHINKGDLQPGDLVFFNSHHVGIYIGGGQIIHAATPALGVRIDNLASAIAYNGYLGAGRY